jgi:hypothetical protein
MFSPEFLQDRRKMKNFRYNSQTDRDNCKKVSGRFLQKLQKTVVKFSKIGESVVANPCSDCAADSI